MASLVLNGNTLGQKSQHYQKLLKDALSTEKPSILKGIDYLQNDIDNFIQIDIANHQKNVDFILHILKCNDMLYISRAIKKCTWLITDEKYAHIINPEYLLTQLFPEMTNKAICKFLLHIRLHLKVESRVDEFYYYYKDKDVGTALKWLPNCSLPVIEEAVKIHINEIENHLLKRLCERSIKFLEIYIKEYPSSWGRTSALKSTMFLLKNNTDNYLKIYENVESYTRPGLGPKATNIILKKYPNIVADKTDIYLEKVNLATFARHLKKENIKDFLFKIGTDVSLKDSGWFSYSNLKYFIKMMPVDEKITFLKTYIDKEYKNLPPSSPEYFFYCALEDNDRFCDKAYNWYALFPFDEAFTELKKLVPTESSPEERNNILSVMLKCAKYNKKHIRSLLQYYHDKHINVPFKFKMQFINKVLSLTKIYRYDEETWNILNKIFHSLEVYIESNNNVDSCVESIILYNILHKQKINEIIDKKSSFNTYAGYVKSLNEEEKDLLFNYLFDSLKKKIDDLSMQSEKIDALATHLNNTITLLSDWEKDIFKFQWVSEKMKELLKIEEQKSKFQFVYSLRKPWRRGFFEESLKLCPSEAVCINALKHDPELLHRHKSEVETLLNNENESLQRLLRIVRTYWPLSFAKEWTSFYKNSLDQPSGYKARICGLLALLPQSEITEMIKKYQPIETKITWSETDAHILSLRKQIAKNMHLTRPQPTVDVVLLYAKGDYLQFALPSIYAIVDNLSVTDVSQILWKFLNAPVSLLKNGLHLIFRKLDTQRIMQVSKDIWNKTKNGSIRIVLFNKIFSLLCKEKESSIVEQLWQILSFYIDSLTPAENKGIYDTLANITEVPYHFKGEFTMKSFRFLKSLPAKSNCERHIKDLLRSMSDFMELLEPDFVADILLDYIKNNYVKMYVKFDRILPVMATYLLCAKDEDAARDRIEKILKPVLTNSFMLWNKYEEERYFVRDNLQVLLSNLRMHYNNYILTKRMIIPVKLFSYALNEIENALPVEENYVIMREWKMVAAYCTVMAKYKYVLDKIEPFDVTRLMKVGCESDYYNDLFFAMVKDFSEISLQYLKDDIKLFYPSIYVLFADAAYTFIGDSFEPLIVFKICKSILDEECIQSYLLVQHFMSNMIIREKEEKEFKKLRHLVLSHPSREVKMHYYNKFNKVRNLELYFNIKKESSSGHLSSENDDEK